MDEAAGKTFPLSVTQRDALSGQFLQPELRLTFHSLGFPELCMRLVVFLLSRLLSASAGALQACGGVRQAAAYERRELSIRVRDGPRLFAVALIPAGAAQAQ